MSETTKKEPRPAPIRSHWPILSVDYEQIDEKAGYGWSVRKDRVANYVKDNNIEIVGMQEVLQAQLEDLLARLPEYD